jgi:hypothetical protein
MSGRLPSAVTATPLPSTYTCTGVDTAGESRSNDHPETLTTAPEADNPSQDPNGGLICVVIDRQPSNVFREDTSTSMANTHT